MPRPLLLLLASLLLALLPAHAQSPDEVASVRQQIDANQDAVGRAIHTNDFAALEKYWSPSMVVNSPGNHVLTRDGVFEAMRHDELHYTRLKTTMESFTLHGDLAIDMGHEDFVFANGPAAGKPLTRRYTNVWQHTPAGWVQIARQATIIGVDGATLYLPQPAK